MQGTNGQERENHPAHICSAVCVEFVNILYFEFPNKLLTYRLWDSKIPLVKMEVMHDVKALLNKVPTRTLADKKSKKQLIGVK